MSNLSSERVVVPSAFSLTGSGQRLWNAFGPRIGRSSGWSAAGWWALLITLGALAWLTILSAYALVVCLPILWPLLLLRLIGRGGRKRHRNELQHREVLAAIERQRPRSD